MRGSRNSRFFDLTRLIAVVLALAGISGCTLGWEFHGARPEPEAVARLEPGMTKADVLKTLGPPDTVGLRMKGSVFIYRYVRSSDQGLSLNAYQASVSYDASDRRTTRLVVFFDKAGKLAQQGSR